MALSCVSTQDINYVKIETENLELGERGQRRLIYSLENFQNQLPAYSSLLMKIGFDCESNHYYGELRVSSTTRVFTSSAKEKKLDLLVIELTDLIKKQ